MKIATITYSWAQNWGAVLQAYALVEYLNSEGHDAKLINYRSFDNKLISTVKSIPDGLIDLLTLPLSKRRIERYNDFRNNYLRLTKKCNTTEELRTLNNEFDAFITGSDQVWNVGLGVCKDFYLEFVRNDKRRISYAASFGVSEIPDQYKADSIEGLNNIQTISVREESGRKIVKSLVNKNAEVVLDPVFLLSAEKWNEVAGKSKDEGKYIFVYPTQVSDLLIKVVKKLKKETGLKVVSPFYVPGCHVVKDIGPREFVSYVANAEYVVASSFHATAFSIIFNKKLFVTTHSKTGSRTTDLLKRIGMDKCVISNVSEMDSVEWNYDKGNLYVQEYIHKSKDFLRRALQ